MSQNVKDNMELIYRTAILVLFSICSYFLYKVDNKLDETYTRTIRLEEQIKMLILK